jgi:hypothetical protein
LAFPIFTTLTFIFTQTHTLISFDHLFELILSFFQFKLDPKTKDIPSRPEDTNAAEMLLEVGFDFGLFYWEWDYRLKVEGFVGFVVVLIRLEVEWGF